MSNDGHHSLGQWFGGFIQWLRGSLHGDPVRNPQHGDDRYVSGGVNWDGYSLESLVKMVASGANPNQLESLADMWRTNGSNIVTGSEDLQRSLTTLMQYWQGAAADEAAVSTGRNAAWLTDLGETTQQIAEPIDDSAGALRSAQQTMPGVPSNNWWAGAGGGAAAGFMVGGPIGAGIGAAIGGIASAFGFGSSKKKLKRKAVQTMTRFEGAVVGIDGSTPQYGGPSTGVNPGGDGIWDHDPGVDGPPGTVTPPTGGPWAPGPNDQLPPNVHPIPGANDPGNSTLPAFTEGPAGRWDGLTNWGGGKTPGFPGGINGPGGIYGPGGINGIGGGIGTGSGPFGGPFGGAFPGAGMGRYGAGMGAGMGGRYGGGGMGAGAGSYGRGGAAARGRFGTSRFGGLNAFGERGGTGGSGYPGGAGAGGRKEDDKEHRRRFPYEEDPFLGDLKAAPPVIGL